MDENQTAPELLFDPKPKLCHEDDVFCGRCKVIVGNHHFFKTKHPQIFDVIFDWPDVNRPGITALPWNRTPEIRMPLNKYRCGDCYDDETKGTKARFILKHCSPKLTIKLTIKKYLEVLK